MVGLVWLATIVQGGAYTAAAEAIRDDGLTIPVELHQGNMLLPVRVNGSADALFIFDTGASVSVIDRTWANRIGLKGEGATTLAAGGGNVAASFAHNVTLDLPRLSAQNQTLALIPLERLPVLFGRDVRGILGNTFIKDYVVELDYIKRRIVLYSPERRSLASNPAALSVENRGGIPYLPVEISISDNAVIRGMFEIDSGSTGTLTINQPFAETHRLLTRIPRERTVEGVGGAGVGGDMKATDARIHALRIGPHTLREPVVSISADSAGIGASEEAGFIGAAVLSRFLVVLDLRSRRILLSPNERWSEPFEADLSGLELMTAPGDFNRVLVKAARGDFPAARAGLKPGDEILEIDGANAGRFGLDRLSTMFKQPDTSYILLVRQNTTERRVVLKLTRRI